jgi:cobalt-precorrin 5A hydrolase
MTPPRILAVGVGCRAGVSGDVSADLVEAALAEAGEIETPVALFTVLDKQSEVGIAEAAARLGFALVHLPRAALAAVADRVETRSERVIELFGVPSIAEGAALAGAGRDPRLLVPRRSDRGATVAVAIGGPAIPRTAPAATAIPPDEESKS